MGSGGLELICAPRTFTVPLLAPHYSFGKPRRVYATTALASDSFTTAWLLYEADESPLHADLTHTYPEQVPAPPKWILTWVPSPDITL